MNLQGGTLVAVAKATAGNNEEDKSRPWREFVNVRNESGVTVFVGSDGYLTVRVRVKQDSAAAGVLRRIDALRFKPKDAVHLDTRGGGSKRAHFLTVENSDVEVQMQPGDGKGEALREPYPDGPEEALGENPGGRPAFRGDLAMLRRACSALLAAGCGTAQFFVAPSAGRNGMIFLVGLDEAGNEVEACCGFPETVERKSKAGETVQRDIPTPLFDGAEKPDTGDEEEPGSDDGSDEAEE